MADPQAQARKQLDRVLADTKKSVAQHAAAVKKAGLDKHGAIVAHFKKDLGLTHGDANLLAHTVRQHLAGGPAPSEELLEAQYAGKKAHLRPLYERLAGIALALGDDVEQVVQKTGVSFRRKKQFALVQAPSAKRVRLGLNLPKTPKDPRVVEVKGMCSHAVDLEDRAAIDDTVAGWIAVAYERAG